jgi:porphobilinogen synthase
MSSPTQNHKHLSLLHRPRRLRRTASLRRMVQENQLTVNDLIYPVFVTEGENQQEEIPSMPEIYRYSLDLLFKEITDAVNLRINAARSTKTRFLDFYQCSTGCLCR